MVFVELEIEAIHPACEDACKMAPSRSLGAGTFVKQIMSGTQHQGSPTIVRLLHRSSSPMPWLCRISPFPSVTHTRPRGLSHTTSQSRWPVSCSVCETNRLSTSKRIVLSSSCVEGKPVVKPCSYKPSFSYILSLDHVHP